MKKTYLNSFCARCLTLLVLALLSTNLAWGTEPAVLFYETFGDNGSSNTVFSSVTCYSATSDMFSTSGTVASHYSGSGKVGKNNVNPSDTYDGASGLSAAWYTGGSGSGTVIVIQIDGIKIKDYQDLSLSFGGYLTNGDLTKNKIEVYYKIGNSAEKKLEYTGLSKVATWSLCTGNITETGESITLIFKQVRTGGYTVRIDDIKLTGTSTATTPTEAYTVTFDAGAHGTCPTTSLTEASAGVGVTLPECTANDGYVFKGWSTTESGTTPNAGKAGETYKPSNNCTLYAIYNALYTVTIETPENGTLVVKDGDTPIANGESVEDGTTLTIEATPNDGYKFRNWQAIDASTHTYTKGTTYSINAHDVTFKANFDEISKYTINYMVNGVSTGAQENVYEGTALVFPTVNDFGGKVFVGWSDAEIAEATDDKPELVNTEGLTATANATYYAVFATLTKGDSETKTDVLDLEFTGVDATSTYSSWSKSAPTSDAVYAGCSAGDKNSIQLRSKNSESGIVSTTTGGSVKKITVVWHNDTQNDRTLNVYGSNDAYTAVTELYDNEKSGTLIGTIVKGTSTELSISDEYAYIGLCSADGAMYLTSISIEWQQGTPDSYSAYCTSVAPRTKEVEITSAKYATLGLPYAVTIPEGVSAYTAIVEGTTVKMTKIQTGKIPANCGVILYAETPKTYTFTETADVDLALDNQLVAVIGETYICGDDHGKDYYLGLSNGQATFKKLNVGGTIAAGKAYLKLDEALSGNAKLDVTFGEPTGIESLTPALSEGKGGYNLNGMKVNEAYKGIVIMNGKKYINK